MNTFPRKSITDQPFDRNKREQFESVCRIALSILIFTAWIIVLPVHGWAQHNRIVYVASKGNFSSEEIYTMAADGTDHKRLTNNAARDFDPAWSPDGKKIAFASSMEGGPGSASDIFVMDADGNNLRNLTQNPRSWDRMPTWSPDGKRIAFVSGMGLVLNSEIYVMDTNGTNIKRLTNNRVADREPAWSPNGKWIAYASEADANENTNIYVISPDGRKRKKLTNQIPEVDQPSWSPDSRKIAFVSRLEGNPDICVMRVDGVLNGNQKPINKGDVTNLTKHIAHDYSPTWSPTGSRIAFNSERQFGRMSIYVMAADGENVVRLTEPRSIHPNWVGPGGFSVDLRRLVTTWGAIKAAKGEKK